MKSTKKKTGPEDREIASAIRQYAALQEVLNTRKIKPTPNFVADVIARIGSGKHKRKALPSKSGTQVLDPKELLSNMFKLKPAFPVIIKSPSIRKKEKQKKQ